MKDLVLSGDQSVPIYQQIKDAICEKIEQGVWQPGQIVPSENQLAEALNVSRMTINRPLRELTADGILRRVHGLGTFVAEPARRAHLIELVSIAEESRQQEKTYRAEVLSHQRIKAGSELCDAMQLAQDTELYKVEIVHFQDDIPIQLERRHVNPKLVPEFINVDFTETTTTEYLISQIRPEEIEHVVKAILPDSSISKKLDIPTNEPCLKLSRRTWKDGQVVTCADLIYPSSRYELGDRYSPSTSKTTL